MSKTPAPARGAPARPPTFLEGLTSRLGDPTVGQNIPLSSYALSIAGVLMITLVWPLVMGGTIALAVALSGEDPHTNAPDDANGWQWFEAGRPQAATGSCNPLSQTQTGNYPNPATQIQTATTPGAFYGLSPGVNYTVVQSPGSGSTNTCGQYQGNADDAWVIGVPAEVLDPGDQDAISRLSWEVVGVSGCSTNVPQCDDGWQFDEVRLEINGTAVLTLTGDDAFSPSCSADWGGGQASCAQSIRFNITLSGIQSQDIDDEMTACLPSCNVTLHYENAEQVCNSSTCYHALAFTTDGRWRFEVFSTNADTAGLTLRLSVWLLFAGTMALAIGATPLWDPLRQYIGRLQAPDISGGSP